MGLADDDSLPAQMDSSAWPAMKDKFAAVFKSKTRDEWYGMRVSGKHHHRLTLTLVLIMSLGCVPGAPSLKGRMLALRLC